MHTLRLSIIWKAWFCCISVCSPLTRRKKEISKFLCIYTQGKVAMTTVRDIVAGVVENVVGSAIGSSGQSCVPRGVAGFH